MTVIRCCRVCCQSLKPEASPLSGFLEDRVPQSSPWTMQCCRYAGQWRDPSDQKNWECNASCTRGHLEDFSLLREGERERSAATASAALCAGFQGCCACWSAGAASAAAGGAVAAEPAFARRLLPRAAFRRPAISSRRLKMRAGLWPQSSSLPACCGEVPLPCKPVMRSIEVMRKLRSSISRRGPSISIHKARSIRLCAMQGWRALHATVSTGCIAN